MHDSNLGNLENLDVYNYYLLLEFILFVLFMDCISLTWNVSNYSSNRILSLQQGKNP